MKRVLFSCLIVCLLVSSSFASPLIFKATKQLETDDLTEFGVIDSRNFSVIRIAVKSGADDQLRISKEQAKRNLESAKTSLKSAQERFNNGSISQMRLDDYKKDVETTQRLFDNASPKVLFYAVEANETVLIGEYESGKELRSIVLDAPPSKLLVKVSGIGKHTIFVWGS